MTVYNVIEIGDDVLRQQAATVRRFDERLHLMLANMAETMYAYDGVGLAAPQIGVSKRIVVIDVGEGLLELVNPEITHAEGVVLGVEGCLSVPDQQGYVYRAAKVHVKAQDCDGSPFEFDAEGYLARACQHEIDHLDGILYVDKLASPSKEEIARLEREEN
jgi:peptide deformylase